MRRIVAGTASAALAIALSACTFTGVNNVPLPLTKGGGSGSYELTVYLANAANLVPNSEVKIDDVTVGSVRRIQFDHWQAKLTLGIEKGVKLPSLTTATIGQKSLLGAEYLQLDAAGPAGTLLRNGDTIPVTRTGRYPETEEVLSALGAVLNGGGLDQINTITRELNAALDGRQQDVRDLIGQLGSFVGTLNDQKTQIIADIGGLNRLAGTFAKQDAAISTALQALPGGIDVLRQERAQLTKALVAVSRFGTVAGQLIDRSESDLKANFDSLRPIVTELANAGHSITQALGDVSFPFPIDASQIVFRGDYINFFATVDLTIPTLERDWLGGASLDGLYSAILGGLPGGGATGSGNPITDPLNPSAGVPANGLGHVVGGLGNDLSNLVGGLTGTHPQGSSGASPSPGAGTGGLGSVLGGLLGAGRS